MFGQHSISNTQTSTNLDILKNNKLQSSTSDTKPFSLFQPSPSTPTSGRLFISVNDLPQNTSSLKTTNLKVSAPLSTNAVTNTTTTTTAAATTPTTTNAAPSVLIPSEGRITKGSLDNALPIFFAGAQQQSQQQQQLSDEQEQEPSTQVTDLSTQKEDGPSIESTNLDTASKDGTVESSINNDTVVNDEIRTIKIFGFPPNMIDTLRKHFERYGRVESSQHSPGSWLSIMYASSTSATAALKSNRMVIADSFMIGVTLSTTNLKPIPSKSVLTPSKQQQQQQQDHVYKSILPVSDGIFADRSNNKKKTTTAGTGQAGISVAGGSTVTTSNRTTIPETTGWVGFFRDILFG